MRIAHGDGQHLAGWFLPGRAGEGAMLLLHGVRGDRLQMLARARWLQRAGIASLIVDLPAHGESSGARITFGRREALGADAALAWLRERAPGERIGALGVSLGGASLLFARREPELDALVLESVYPTIDEAVQDRLAMRLGPTAARLLAPLLLVQLPLRLELSARELRPVDAIRTGGCRSSSPRARKTGTRPGPRPSACTPPPPGRNSSGPCPARPMWTCTRSTPRPTRRGCCPGFSSGCASPHPDRALRGHGKMAP